MALLGGLSHGRVSGWSSGAAVVGVGAGTDGAGRAETDTGGTGEDGTGGGVVAKEGVRP